MKAVVYSTYFIGIALFVQGIGGLINRLVQSDGPSWFLQLHLIPDTMQWLQITISVILMIVGGVLFMAANKKAKQAGINLD